MTKPFKSAPATVLDEWIDFNGHLNMAYYNVLFDQAVDQAYLDMGFGPDYQKTGFTTYVAEFHVCYLRELHAGDQVYVTLQLLDYDEKRFHTYQELWHSEGWCAATGEGLTLHIDQSGPRVAPMPDHILSKVETLHKSHSQLPRPERAGRSVGIRR